MSYNKFISYGSKFELFRYEREPSIHRGASRKNASDDGFENSGDGGSSLLGLSSETRNGIKTKRQDHAKRAQMAFRRLVISNLQGHENPILFTATYRKNETDVSKGFSDFTSCVQSLRYKFGQAFRYICVPEFQRRGAVHFHALFWGIQKELLGIQREWPSNSIDCYYWDYGFVFVKDTNGHEKIATYLSKYMVKAFKDSRLVGKKAYVASRNIVRPKQGSVSDLGLDYVLEDYLGVDNYPILQRQYMTQYLGNCNYQLYNIK